MNLPGLFVMKQRMSAPLWETKATQSLEAGWAAKSTPAITPKLTRGSLAQVCTSTSVLPQEAVLMHAMICH